MTKASFEADTGMAPNRGPGLVIVGPPCGGRVIAWFVPIWQPVERRSDADAKREKEREARRERLPSIASSIVAEIRQLDTLVCDKFGPMLKRLPLVALFAAAPLVACSSDKANGPAIVSPGDLLEGDAGRGEVKTLFVHEARVDCEGEGPRKCLQVREPGDSEWSYFYSTIEGFDYEEGTRYELRVSVEEVEDPPADGSSLRYVLVEIVSAQKMSSGG